MAKPPSDPCPCDPARAYGKCCGRFHAADAADAAPDAETLMRSRYSAYARGVHDYLLITWHSSTRPATLELDEAPNARLRWLGLEVLEHHRDDADHARVRFVARFRVGGQSAQRLRELSRFVREEGRWFYLDGDVD